MNQRWELAWEIPPGGGGGAREIPPGGYLGKFHLGVAREIPPRKL